MKIAGMNERKVGYQNLWRYTTIWLATLSIWKCKVKLNKKKKSVTPYVCLVFIFLVFIAFILLKYKISHKYNNEL